MQVDDMTVEAEDVALAAQYVLAEAYDAYQHDLPAFYESAMEVAGGLESLVKKEKWTVGDLAQLADEAEVYGLKSEQDIRSLVAWMLVNE